ncbi:hypothetical protein O181_073449 [Austropuccinia psidii MF-1]|uniref:Uncharacterized protein n=1 Tax=Austropuccinia psidii MF-1 TaxID=1389203 RepID=A0A9Q3F746_9BASI|nr:hypothetical protein [Austropuccinia psidii MF-1]
MQNASKIVKLRWGKNHKTPYFIIGDLVLVSSSSFKNINRTNKLEDSFSGMFIIRSLHGPNSAQLDLTGELMNKHPPFPVVLIKTHSLRDKELIPLRNEPPLEIPPLEEE